MAATLQSWTFNGFMLEDGLGQAQGRFSRGVLKNAHSIPKKQTISSVVAHAAGEVRTASRDVVKEIVHTGFVWGNPTQDEAGLMANLDTLKAALCSGPVGPLCLWDDGRYYLAELVQFDDGLQEGNPNWTEYTATWHAYDPYAYGAVTETQLLTNATLTPTNPGSSLYVYRTGGTNAAMPGMGLGVGYPLPVWSGLGSAASALQVRVQFVHANGAIRVAALNPQAQPVQTASATAAPFSDGDVVLFDGPGQQTLVTHNGVTSGSTAPSGTLTLLPGQLQTAGLVIAVRSPVGPPVVSVTLTYQARYA